jgi:hypothetical protein
MAILPLLAAALSLIAALIPTGHPTPVLDGFLYGLAVFNLGVFLLAMRSDA